MKKSSTRPKAIPPSLPTKPTTAAGPNLGECLRQLRHERRLSITEVAVATGISKSTLSRVEKNQLSLTYDKLLQLCSGLQIDLATLVSFDRSPDRTTQMTRRTFTRPGEGRLIKVNLHAYNYVCTELAGKKMTPMTGVIESRTLAETNGMLKHEGEEYVYVIEGQLELHTEFYEPLVLDAGGSAYFDGTMAHAYVSTGSTPLKIVCVCSTPDTELTKLLGRLTDAAAAAPSRSPARRARS